MVFHKNINVLNTYSKFIESHQKSNSEIDAERTRQRLNDMIVEMGKDLGYTQMNNSWLADSFYPRAAEIENLAHFAQNEDYLKNRLEKPQNQQANN
jgi:hypothetical protein